EDGVRRITHLPAMVTGLKARGLLARGYHADILVFDPARLALGRKELVRDMPGGEERWQVRPEGVVSVIVNGDPILEDGKLTGAQPFTVNGKPAYQFANASAFAERTVVREQSAIPIDPRVPFDRAALIGCGIMTGVGAVVNRAKVETGATMAVFGLGGIGLSCVQGGVLAGAAKIVAVDVVAEKLALARRLGATHTVDASRDDPVAAIKELTGGGADYAFEAVGNLAVIKQALDA